MSERIGSAKYDSIHHDTNHISQLILDDLQLTMMYELDHVSSSSVNTTPFDETISIVPI